MNKVIECIASVTVHEWVFIGAVVGFCVYLVVEEIKHGKK